MRGSARMRPLLPALTLLSATLVVAPRVLAVRPFVTDDARVVGQGEAQLETWLRADDTGLQHWVVAAYGPFHHLEVSAGGMWGGNERTGAIGFAAPLFQAKTLLRDTPSGSWLPGLAFVVGAVTPLGAGSYTPAGWDTFGYLALSANPLASNALLLHLNLGFYTARRNTAVELHALTWGIGTQIRITDQGLHIVAELVSGDPYLRTSGGAAQVGLRHFISKRMQIDVTVGHGLWGDPVQPTWATTGLRLSTSPADW